MSAKPIARICDCKGTTKFVDIQENSEKNYDY